MAKDDLDDVLNKLAEITKPVIKHIESTPELTKDRYDSYMAAISKFAAMLGEDCDTKTYLGIAVAMCRAGGNKSGIHSALRVMGHM